MLSAKKHHILWAIISLFYSYQYMLRIMPLLMKSEMMQKFHITEVQFAQFAGLYYIAYAAAHIPIAFMLRYLSPKVLVPSCIMCCALGFASLLYEASWGVVIASRIICGFASACAAIGGLELFRHYFGKERFSTVFGYMMTVGLLITVISTNMIAAIISTYSLDVVLKICCIVGICIALLAVYFLPSSHIAKNVRNTMAPDLKKVFTDKRLLILSLIGGLMIGPLEGFSDAWGVEFLQIAHNISYEDSAAICSMIFLGMAIGTSALPHIERRLLLKMKNGTDVLLVICAISMLFAFLFLILPWSDFLASHYYYLFAILLGFFSGYQVLLFGKIVHCVPKSLSGLACSVVNLIMMSFGELYHTTIGIISDNIIENGGKMLYHSMYPICISIIVAIFILGYNYSSAKSH